MECRQLWLHQLSIARKPFTSLVFRVIEEVGRARLELATNALKGRCSTIELPTRFREVMQRHA